MRQVHLAGDKLFVDYSGKKAHIVDPDTGEVNDVELFVAVLGASNYTYAEATATQRGPDWIASHVRTLEYIGGAPAALVCDQLKSGVTRACRYEPEAQRTYEELAEHYQTTVMPARPKHPRDKAAVEVGVQLVQRWILARIRNEVFHSLGELNARIRELLVDLNGRVMRRYGKSRHELFEHLEREKPSDNTTTPSSSPKPLNDESAALRPAWRRPVRAARQRRHAPHVRAHRALTHGTDAHAFNQARQQTRVVARCYSSPGSSRSRNEVTSGAISLTPSSPRGAHDIQHPSSTRSCRRIATLCVAHAGVRRGPVPRGQRGDAAPKMRCIWRQNGSQTTRDSAATMETLCALAPRRRRTRSAANRPARSTNAMSPAGRARDIM